MACCYVRSESVLQDGLLDLYLFSENILTHLIYTAIRTAHGYKNDIRKEMKDRVVCMADTKGYYYLRLWMNRNKKLGYTICGKCSVFFNPEKADKHNMSNHHFDAISKEECQDELSRNIAQVMRC